MMLVHTEYWDTWLALGCNDCTSLIAIYLLVMSSVVSYVHETWEIQWICELLDKEKHDSLDIEIHNTSHISLTLKVC